MRTSQSISVSGSRAGESLSDKLASASDERACLTRRSSLYCNACATPTFFTRDEDFYERHLCHARYSLVYLSVEKSEAAWFIRRLLRHPYFKTQTMRMGKVM